VEQVITAGGKFHADETVWTLIKYGDLEIFAFLLVMNFCDIVAFLLLRFIPPCEMMMLNFVI
jgi:hypothetical protein